MSPSAARSVVSASIQRFSPRAKADKTRAERRLHRNWRGARRKLSARNQLKGKIVEVTKGATTAHVRIDIGGAVVTASITNEAVDELQLKVGDEAIAIVEASDVMVAKA